MGPQSHMNWLRRLLLAGLCCCLALQMFVVQMTSIEAAFDDGQPVLCHNVSEDDEDGGKPFTPCHLCWLPASGHVLLSDAGPVLSIPSIVVAPAYSAAALRFTVLKPPPRGYSRAPPSFA